MERNIICGNQASGAGGARAGAREAGEARAGARGAGEAPPCSREGRQHPLAGVAGWVPIRAARAVIKLYL